MVNSARTVQCWSWGSENGNGNARLHNFAGNEYCDAKYKPLYQFAGLNLVVCKLGSTDGTASTGDIMIVPATQSAPDATGINNPLPLHGENTVMLPSSRAGVAAATLNSGSNYNLAIMAGTDDYLGTMTYISSASTNFADTVQDGDATGVAGKATALPWNVGGTNLDAAVYNDNNAGGAGGVWDITAVTAAEWIIGSAKLAGLLRFT